GGVCRSVVDPFKIGIGPSSSHTVGPMVAAERFLTEIAEGEWPRPAAARIARLSVSLHGSLAFTGVGHATDRAIILGLQGFTPVTVDPDRADALVERIGREKRLSPPGHPG